MITFRTIEKYEAEILKDNVQIGRMKLIGDVYSLEVHYSYATLEKVKNPTENNKRIRLLCEYLDKYITFVNDKYKKGGANELELLSRLVNGVGSKAKILE